MMRQGIFFVAVVLLSIGCRQKEDPRWGAVSQALDKQGEEIAELHGRTAEHDIRLKTTEESVDILSERSSRQSHAIVSLNREVVSVNRRVEATQSAVSKHHQELERHAEVSNRHQRRLDDHDVDMATLRRYKDRFDQDVGRLEKSQQTIADAQEKAAYRVAAAEKKINKLETRMGVVSTTTAQRFLIRIPRHPVKKPYYIVFDNDADKADNMAKEYRYYKDGILKAVIQRYDKRLYRDIEVEVDVHRDARGRYYYSYFYGKDGRENIEKRRLPRGFPIYDSRKLDAVYR